MSFVAPDLAALKATDISQISMIFDGVVFTWTAGDFTGRTNDVDIVQSDDVLPTGGAWVRQSAELAYLRNFGADPSGVTSSVAAFEAALAAGKQVKGVPGDVYLLDGPVVVPSGREIVGNGAALKIGSGAIGLRLDNDNCRVSGWTIIGNGGLFSVLNTGRFNEFSENLCTGNIGHFFFSLDAEHVLATRNVVDGLSADEEITTAIAVQGCRHITITDNRFRDIPVGWSIQIRDGSEDFAVLNNNFLQTQYLEEKTATAGQKVFNFTLGSACPLRKIQIDGKPLSLGYTIEGTGTSFTVTFSEGRAAGEKVKLVGYRGAENIQVNSGARFGAITGNVINGTGDSGIIAHGSNLTITGNTVRNAGYAGIAIYGDQDDIVVAGNVVADCAQMDDGLSSPDNADLRSAFAGAILSSGRSATITGNTIVNASGTMRYGIFVNNSEIPLRTDGRAAIAISANSFSGAFADGRIYVPNQTSGARVNSIAVDGVAVEYPEQINLDQMWTNSPPSTPYFATSGFGGTIAIRDTSIKMGGAASLKTVAAEYVDFSLSAAGIFRGCNVTISFWAKAGGGSSYFSVFTFLEGLAFPLTAEITDPAWKQYSISFPLTPNLDDAILIRCGSGLDSVANFQHITINGVRL